jgi:uncharacterized Ntn-hydrolase superfamily protein
MTWSIIATNRATAEIGIAVATKFFAVGARVPHIAARFGGIATQALVNPYYGIDGLKLLRAGKSPQEVVATLIAADAGRESRQLHIMDVEGRIAVHTGRECVEWCGHIQGEGFSIAGNMLASARVLDETAQQSAALLIHGEEDWPALDLRVDDHPDPLTELERLERVSRERRVHFREFMPTRKNPAGITDRAVIEARIEAAIAADK